MGRLRKSPEKALAVVKGDVPMVVRGSSTGKLVGSGGGFRLPVDMVNFLFLFLAQSPGVELKQRRSERRVELPCVGNGKSEGAMEGAAE